MWFSILLACSAKQVATQPTEQLAVETVNDRALYAQLQAQLDEWSAQGKPDTITPAREQVMNDLASWIREKQQKNETSALIFVCMHSPHMVLSSPIPKSVRKIQCMKQSLEKASPPSAVFPRSLDTRAIQKKTLLR